MLIYCDSVILMYYFDHVGLFNVRAGTRLAALAANGDHIVISDLVRLEYRVKPLKNNEAAKLALFDAFCARPDVQLAPMSKAVFDRATVIRAAHSFKLGDSLHLAAAVLVGCDLFLTNDSLGWRTSRIFPSKCYRDSRTKLICRRMLSAMALSLRAMARPRALW
jgi:predicted nucleic acid-binding protein